MGNSKGKNTCKNRDKNSRQNSKKTHNNNVSILPLYRNAASDQHGGKYHKGLLFERFFKYSGSWDVKDQAKLSSIRSVTGPCGDEAQLTGFARRSVRLVNSLRGQYQVYKLEWHFVTGMGNAHPVENGFLWHPVLGTPYIPGSTIKGVLRSWLEQELPDGEVKKQKLLQWFGSDSKEPQEQAQLQAGQLVFHDAIPIRPAILDVDIMTPHMGKWYERGGEGKPSEKADSIPADWHDPIPIPFLIVKECSFLFSISPRTAELDRNAITEAMSQLEMALEWLGVGAKTAVGYGSMSKNKTGQEKLRRGQANGQ